MKVGKENKDIHSFELGKREKSVVFENDGDVNIDLNRVVAISRCKLTFKNKGNVNILGMRKYPFLLSFRNSGNVTLQATKVEKNTIIKNKGNFVVTKNAKIESEVKFQNGGDVVLVESIVGGNVIFENKGNVVLTNIKLGKYVKFWNRKNVILDNPKSFMHGTFFKNYGNVTISGVNTINSYGGFVPENMGDFSFPDLVELKCASKIFFFNRGNVDIPKLESLDGIYRFKNGGDVVLKKLQRYDSIKSLFFENGGHVYLNSLELEKCAKALSVNNAGNLYIGDNIDKIKTRYRINPKGYIQTKKGTLLPNQSFLKRYKPKIENGIVTLYKGVLASTGTAPYDKSKTKWEPNKTIEIDYWNPYKTEIGDGKYVASPYKDIFKKLISRGAIKIFELQIAIPDLYEWGAVGKYPQVIGFRKAYVVREIPLYTKKK